MFFRKSKVDAGQRTSPIIIYGAPRSGTTYLNSILNQHPQVFITHETRLFAWAHQSLAELTQRNQYVLGHRARFVDHLRETYPGLIRDFYKKLRPSARYWGDKNPHYASNNNAGCLETIQMLYPETRFIHIIRDGRDVVNSLLRQRTKQGKPWANFESAHRIWKTHVDRGCAFGRSQPPDRYFELRYEDLIEDDLGLARRLFDFLDIEIHPRVVEFCQKQQQERTPFSKPVSLAAGTQTTDGQANGLTPEQRLYSIETIGEHLVRHGYETEASLAQARRELAVPVERRREAERQSEAEPRAEEVGSASTRLSWQEASAAVLGYASEEKNSPKVAQLIRRILGMNMTPTVYPKQFRLWEEHGFHLSPVHFYYPTPDTRTLKEDVWKEESALAGVDMNDEVQLRFLREVFPRYRDEYERFPLARTDTPHEYYFQNPMFAGYDALALYCMVRHFRPDTVLEVGSGFSTRVSARAALENGHTRVISIEPYPDEVLKEGFPGLTSLVPEKVQDVDLARFEELGSGDVLFIDSSHVAKIGGDVNYLYLEVLPRLKPGVVVHVHDIFFPLEYPRHWVMNQLRFWNEQYLLQAFLAFNSEYEVLLCNSYLNRKHGEELRAALPAESRGGGGSFWMRRKEEGR